MRVYNDDVDYMGIVHHANYVLYFERARTELFREGGHSLVNLQKQGIMFVINQLSLKYSFPAKLDDALVVNTEIDQMKACTLTFMQTIKNQHEQLICEANVKVVCVDLQIKPRVLPEMLKAFARQIQSF